MASLASSTLTVEQIQALSSSDVLPLLEQLNRDKIAFRFRDALEIRRQGLALKKLESYLELLSADKDHFIPEGFVRSEVFCAAGHIAHENGWTLQAKRYFETARAAYEDHPSISRKPYEIRRLSCHIELGMGIVVRNLDKNPESVVYFLRARDIANEYKEKGDLWLLDMINIYREVGLAYLKQGLHQEMLSAFTFALDLLKKEIKPSPRQPTYSEAVVDLLNPRAPTAFNFYPPLLNYLTMAHHKILLELKNCLKDLKKKHKEAQSIPESDLIAAQYHELQKVVDERERTHHELRDQVSKLYLSLPEAFRAMAFDYVSSQSHAATEAVDRGRPQDAIPMLKEVLELRRKYLAETHRGLIGESAVALGRAYLKINDLRNAEICLCQAKDEFKRVYAHDNPGDDRGAIKAYAREKTKTLGDEVARERSKLVDGVADSLGSLMLELSRTATQTAAVARLDWSAVAPAPAEDVVMRNVEDASTTSAP